MSEATELDINSIPLEQIDVSDATIYGNDTWQPYFAQARSVLEKSLLQ